jgi:TM2 domain-containing membrane protein YozV
MREEFESWEETGEVRVRRLPSPGFAAVLAVLFPGLGHVYAGRLVAGAIWFLAISFAYWAILVPGFLLHAISIWTAYRAAEEASEHRWR